MTIETLIETLKQYDPKTLVLVNGYESGYDDVANVSQETVFKYPTTDYDGEYQTEIYQTDHLNRRRRIKAVIIKRG